ncbi:MAG: MFS transporter [Bacteroidales bacterium]|nr:MFS transporter [Bacteroidales bacterium]
MSTKNLYRSTPIFLAFLCMGFGDVVSPLSALLKDEFALSHTSSQLVTFVGLIMFGVLSVPMGIYQGRKGKKFVLQIGLVVALLGLLIPTIFGFDVFALLLVSVLFLGAGSAILQVAGNPIMRDVSPEGKYSRNLAFGQFIKAIGTLSGMLIPVAAVKWWDMDWKLLFPIYSIGLFLTVFILALTKINESKTDESQYPTMKSCLLLLKNKYVLSMVLGIFFYVGAEVSLFSKIPIYLQEIYDFDLKTWGLLGSAFVVTAILIGRFSGALVLNWISARQFLIISTFTALVGMVGLFIPVKAVAIAAIFISGLGFANIFPMIFSIAIEKMPERSNELSGLMITAIIGGAFVPMLFSAVADITGSLMAGFIVPILCFVYIGVIALRK